MVEYLPCLIMLCVECGKSEEIYKDGVCSDCYVKGKQFSKGPAILDLVQCQHCKHYQWKNTWLNENFEEMLRRFIFEYFTISAELGSLQVELSNLEPSGNKVFATIAIKGKVGSTLILEEHLLTLRLKYDSCDVCSKRHGRYFESIIQIRAERRSPDEEEIQKITQLVEEQVELMREHGTRDLFITEITKEKGGIDVYLSNKASAKNIVRLIQTRFGGAVKQSPSLVGMKDGKNITRMTYLLRLFSYRVGDVFFFEKGLYLVKDITGTKTGTLNLNTWDERSFTNKNLDSVKVFSKDHLSSEVVIVSQSATEVQIMNTKTYEISDLKKPKDISFEPGKVINALYIDETYYLVP